MVRYEVSGFREQGTGNTGTVAGSPEMMPNPLILHLCEKRCQLTVINSYLARTVFSVSVIRKFFDLINKSDRLTFVTVWFILFL
jgi:hypothetical protein